MKRLLSVASMCAVVLLSGCAATKDGVRVPGTGTSQADVKSFNERFNKASEEAAKEAGKQVVKNELKEAILTDSGKEGGRVKLVAIGATMAFTETTQKQQEAAYDHYEKVMKEKGLPITMTRDWYLSRVAGSASVRYWEIPLVMGKQIRAEVSKDMKDKIGFPSAFGASMVGSTGDLVVAQQFENTGIWITNVLCAEGKSDFKDCASKYERGLYQGIDGREIDGSLNVVNGGKQIDLATFLPVQKAAQ